MNKEKILSLEKILKSGINTVLIEDIDFEFLCDYVLLDAACDNKELNGHYENIEFVAPEWYKTLMIKKNPVLIIKEINKLSLEEQTKFVEILKYKKISTFELPKNTIIIVTCKNLKNHKINEEIYSLVAHI